MPEENPQPSLQPNRPSRPSTSPQVIQPTNSNVVSPASSAPTDLVAPASTQSTAMVNGQPFQPTTSISSNQFEQIPERRPSKWRFLFIILGILQILVIALFFFIIWWAVQQAKAGVSGTEFIGLILFITLVPAAAILAIINLIGLPIYIKKHKPHGKGMVFSILSLAVSIILVLYGAYSIYQFRVALPRESKQITQEYDQKFQAEQKQFATDNAQPEITKDEAVQLLQSCQLKGFYYTNQTDKSDPTNGGWGELSSTGVVLTKIDGQPYRISIADKLVSELVPIARASQRTCGEPQFWHDGNYEQYQNGHWYFKEQVVN